MSNSDLATARSNKADEFYTEYSDIAKEMQYYTDQFRDKVVYCPCDDYRFSNFYKYFKDNFHNLGLNSLVATSYHENSRGLCARYDGQREHIYELESDGDFDSEECHCILLNSDIVVTNPPFSKFRLFVSMLRFFGNDFIILGNVNAVTYKEVFPDIVNKKINIGPSVRAGDRKFRVPDDYPLEGTACTVEDGVKYIRVKGVRWFTTLNYSDDFTVNHSVLTKFYYSEKYDKYDNYDAINVNTGKEIPCDYIGEMGVPLTVIDKINSKHEIEFKDEDGYIIKYKLVGMMNSGNGRNFDFAKPVIDGKCKFKRLVIKKI